MANNGTYGTKKPALISASDVDIFYYYRPSRSTDDANFNAGFKKVSDPGKLLSTCQYTTANGTQALNLPGMYNLKLPVDMFGVAGIYTIYIKPREINATILDIGVLTAFPNIRGVVINSNNTDSDDTTIFNNGNLVGYRIDYYDTDTGEQTDMYRIITSNNRCEPVAQNFNDVTSKGIKYRFNDSSNLIFCTVTPSSAMSFKSNDTPSIGSEGQPIKLINTKFNPIALEIEMTENDLQDVVTMLEGDQIRNLDNGLITTFNDNGDIYHQAEYGNIVDTQEGTHTDFKFKKDDSNIVASEKDKLNTIKQQI